MKRESCTNCGHTLTTKNIELALKEANLPQNELLFFCPSYAPSEVLGGDPDCNGAVEGDKNRPAYWLIIFSEAPHAIESYFYWSMKDNYLMWAYMAGYWSCVRCKKICEYDSNHFHE